MPTTIRNWNSKTFSVASDKPLKKVDLAIFEGEHKLCCIEPREEKGENDTTYHFTLDEDTIKELWKGKYTGSIRDNGEEIDTEEIEII